MAIKYLNNIDLSQNELQNAVVQNLGSNPSSPLEGQIYFNTTSGNKKLWLYDGSGWVDASGDIKSVSSGTATTLSVQNPAGPNPSFSTITAAVINGGTALATGDQIYDFVVGQNYLTGNQTITLSGDLSGSGTTAINATISSGAVEAGMLNNNVISGRAELSNGIASTDELLISDAGVVKRTDVSVLEAYMQSNLTFTANTDNDVNVANLTARLPEITESVTIGDATDVTITTSGDLTVTGDLTVSGTTTTVNSATLNVADNIVTLNSDVTGAPSQNAGIEVNRGTSTDVAIRWNETALKWQLTNNGTTYADITTGAHPVTATDSAEGLVELATDTEALAGTSDAVVVTPSNLAARSWKGTIGDGSATAITVTHSLNTRDVIIQLYDASSYDTVYADVVRTTVDTATITFTSAPATGDIIVLVTKVQ